MGRVSRHKKIKSCDPFYKGKKKDLSVLTKKNKRYKEGRELEEQKMPRAMKDLLERAQQMKEKKKKKLKRLDTGNTQLKTKKRVLFQQQEGESNREYFHRIDQEAAVAVVESLKKNQKMSEKRKSYLKKKKEKLKIKKNPERALSTFKDFSEFKDEVKFGEVALQPPELTAKPRKAPSETRGSKSLLLSSKFSTEQQTLQSADKRQDSDEKHSIPKSKKRKHMTEIEKAVMDKERMRVIEAYRAAKKKKQLINNPNLNPNPDK